MNTADHILLSGLIAKDKEAYGQLYDIYHKALCKYAFGFVKTVEAAEDVVQETFIKLWKSNLKFSPDLNIKSYLYRSVRNNAIDYIKTQIKEDDLRKNLLLNAKLMDEEVAESAEERETLINSVNISLKKIPENSRRVLEMSRYKGLKHKEIAQQLNITVKGVEYHISRALRCLEKELTKTIHVV